ncbi:MAG: Gp15 family bacteriophage protein [Ruthenibacterium sp.]
MMGLLNSAPESVQIDGVQYAIHTDFRVSIQIEQMALHGEMQTNAGVQRLLKLYFPVCPQNKEKACEIALWFFLCGQTNPKKQTTTNRITKRAYDYDLDAPYIFAAFMADYKIDLSTSALHWWKFHALFESLRPDNIICKIMEYRTNDLTKFKGADRAFYAQMQKQYALPVLKETNAACDAVAEFLMQPHNPESR